MASSSALTRLERHDHMTRLRLEACQVVRRAGRHLSDRDNLTLGRLRHPRTLGVVHSAHPSSAVMPIQQTRPGEAKTDARLA